MSSPNKTPPTLDEFRARAIRFLVAQVRRLVSDIDERNIAEELPLQPVDEPGADARHRQAKRARTLPRRVNSTWMSSPACTAA